ncbi:hypothetical protein [Micromonospora tarensis]|uniref:Uncharacterized protein n=1 Tax=Micromonospora tarensis TaxID=2806100 RepID=A0ABS1Y9V2_9ACTN|nr:hypothetical protein [Micromonospora tarensis]MBM0274153.1 hypothetical protein [Micromonospora tarensis]
MPTGRQSNQQIDDATAKRAEKAARRLDDLAKTVDEATMAAAQKQLRLTLGIRQQLFAGIGGGEVDEWTRQQLDRTSAEARRAALRSKITLQRGHAALSRPRTEPTVDLGLIRVPAHLAARIGSGREPEPTQSGGALDALVDVVAEPVAGSPPGSVAAHRSARGKSVTEPVRESAQRDDKKLAQAYARLTKKLGHPPTGEQLGTAAGVSKATANRWKQHHTPTSNKEK